MSSMNEKDYYAILGVEPDATKQEIQKAFQQKARKLHPDVNKAPDAEERFKEVSEAYAVLSDDEKRAHYDAMRSGGPFGGPVSPSGGYAGGMPVDPFDWVGFPFGAPMGRSAQRSTVRSRSYNPQAGADVVYHLDLDADQARAGCRRGITYQRYVPCEACDGVGSVRADHAETCPTCGGTGHISVDLASLFGIGEMRMVCPECEGTGKVVLDPCTVCGGSGRVLSASETVIDVPAGSHDGDVVRVPRMGNAGTNGSTTGDLVCRVGVAAERLTPRQAQGFELVGFALPFVALGLMTGTLVQLLLVIVVPALVGVALLVSNGAVGRHGGTWWKNAGRALGNGFMTGATTAVFVALLVSCMSGLGTSGYRGPAASGVRT